MTHESEPLNAAMFRLHDQRKPGKMPSLRTAAGVSRGSDAIADIMNTENLASPPSGRLLVKRQGSSITRRMPKPVVVIDNQTALPCQRL
jgi:hypothetical protein